MKNLLLIPPFLLFCVNSFAQNLTIQNNLQSVTITPDAIKTNAPYYGDGNVILGQSAMGGYGHISRTATQNVAIGTGAYYGCIECYNNVVIGYAAMSVDQAGGYGHDNVILGNNASLESINNSKNVVIGSFATARQNNGCVIIGYQAGIIYDGTISPQHSFLYIDNSKSNSPLIGGDFTDRKVGINRPIGSITNAFEVEGEASKTTAGSWAGNSDKRLKKSIVYMNSQEMLQKVLQMKGVSYEWNDDKTGMKRPTGIQFGFIAQDLQQVFPTKVKEDKLGYLQTAYGDYDPMFVEAIRALNDKIEKLEKENFQLKADNKELMQMKDEFAEIKALILKKGSEKTGTDK